ncbi:MAG: sigma-70 family RNA polymerase sigma factor [Anaerolineae bacterium]
MNTVSIQEKTATEAQEKLWLEQARNGNQAAFGRLIEAYERPVYNLAYRMLGNAAEAEDATQETFVRMYTKLATCDPSRKLASWVLSIAAHYCIDRLRRRRINWLSLDEEPVGAVLSDHHLDPEESAVRSEARAEVQDAVMRLEPSYRLPLILHYWYGFSYEEIAEIMHISVQAVKSRMHRARLRLAEHMPRPAPAMARALGVE